MVEFGIATIAGATMRIAQIVGSVTLNQIHPSMRGGTLKIAIPLGLDDLQTAGSPQAEDLVLYDEFGAGLGDRVLLSEGAEAAQPFFPNLKPVDAYNAGILDEITLNPKSQS